MLLVTAANLPDIDIILGLISRDAYVFLHRGITHSVHGVMVEAFLLAWVFRLVSPVKHFAPLVGLALLGLASHVLMDLATSWGTMIFSPLSERRYAWRWVAIVDPWVWGLPALGLVAGLCFKAWSVRVNRIMLGVLAGYYLLCSGSQGLAESHFQQILNRLRISVERIEAFPQFQNPFRWNVIGWTSDRYYQGYVHALDGLQGRLRVYFRAGVPVARQGPFVKAYQHWAAAPLVRPLISNRQGALALCDLRFMGRIEGLPFVVELGRDESGQAFHRWLDRAENIQPPGADQEFELP